MTKKQRKNTSGIRAGKIFLHLVEFGLVKGHLRVNRRCGARLLADWRHDCEIQSKLYIKRCSDNVYCAIVITFLYPSAQRTGTSLNARYVADKILNFRRKPKNDPVWMKRKAIN